MILNHRAFYRAKSLIKLCMLLQTEVDKETQDPLDKLLPYTKDWIQTNGKCKVDTVQDVLNEIYEKKNQEVSILC